VSDRILVTVSGSAGVGKDTVVQEALPRLSEIGIGWVKSVVTRLPRTTDDPSGYRYVDRDSFLHLINDSAIMEFTEVQGEMYGTPSDAFDAGERGGIKIVTVDGVRSIRRWMTDRSIDEMRIFSVYLTAPESVTRRRLRDRGWDDEKIDERLSYDLSGYGPRGVDPAESEIWHLVIENSVRGGRFAADILLAAVESLLWVGNPASWTIETSGGSTTSAPTSPRGSGMEMPSLQPARDLWPPPEGSGSIPPPLPRP